MITVLLATYNGEKYLAAQLDSLLCQTVSNFCVLIRDDGSDDSTPDIISRYCRKYPHVFSVLSGAPVHSACANFAALLSAADDTYYMFCDQDDIWAADKIEKTLSEMQKAEAANPGIPVLVHTDLRVVNSDLQLMSDSFFAFQAITPGRDSLANLLVQNIVTGCTVMVNRELAGIAGAIPADCAMHDWWLALVAAAFGKIVCVNEPLISYRQHGGNRVGAKKASGIGFIRRKLATLDTVKQNYAQTYRQARLLLERYGDILSDDKRCVLEAYCSLSEMPRIKKIRLAREYDFLKNTALRRIGQYLLM